MFTKEEKDIIINALSVILSKTKAKNLEKLEKNLINEYDFFIDKIKYGMPSEFTLSDLTRASRSLTTSERKEFLRDAETMGFVSIERVMPSGSGKKPTTVITKLI